MEEKKNKKMHLKLLNCGKQEKLPHTLEGTEGGVSGVDGVHISVAHRLDVAKLKATERMKNERQSLYTIIDCVAYLNFLKEKCCIKRNFCSVENRRHEKSKKKRQ